ncbi:hypothetical protein KIPB_007387 [Kipferlia bialata]|uniref:RING-type domain-containing protein n=1 Tax=Kipferlia bialata TaxID=797122 RepID=A0A9K3GJY6_9EUKA|nr:hypothetical protein KIPB_007387 [Kipferlia bialata]|eukprot:g7387.t1
MELFKKGVDTVHCCEWVEHIYSEKSKSVNVGEGRVFFLDPYYEEPKHNLVYCGMVKYLQNGNIELNQTLTDSLDCKALRDFDAGFAMVHIEGVVYICTRKVIDAIFLDTMERHRIWHSTDRLSHVQEVEGAFAVGREIFLLTTEEVPRAGERWKHRSGRLYRYNTHRPVGGWVEVTGVHDLLRSGLGPEEAASLREVCYQSGAVLDGKAYVLVTSCWEVRDSHRDSFKAHVLVYAGQRWQTANPAPYHGCSQTLCSFGRHLVLYDTECLRKWLTTKAEDYDRFNTTCPVGRESVTLKDCLAIFMHTQDPSSLTDIDQIRLDMTHLEDELKAARAEVHLLKKRQASRDSQKTENRPRMQCPVCSTSDDNPYVATKCGHVFHKECLRKWLGTKAENYDRLNTTCPVCRETVTLKDCLAIFTSAESTRPLSEREQADVDIARVEDELKAKRAERDRLQCKKGTLRDEIAFVEDSLTQIDLEIVSGSGKARLLKKRRDNMPVTSPQVCYEDAIEVESVMTPLPTEDVTVPASNGVPSDFFN